MLDTETAPAMHALCADDRSRMSEYRRHLQHASDRDDIASCLLGIREWLDIEEVMLFSSTLSYADHQIVGVGYDPAWMNLYMREGFAHVDPIINEIFLGNRFFSRGPLIKPFGSLLRSRSVGTLFRRLAEAALDFGRPAHGHVGGMVDGGRFMLLSAPASASPNNARVGVILGALFPSMMDAMSQLSLRAPDVPQLSLREIHLLKLLADGLIDAEIAAALGISTATVRFHMQNLFQKLQARNRCHVIALAYRYGYLSVARLQS